MSDLPSLDAAAMVGLVGALAGAAGGLLGVGLGSRNARKQERTAVRRAAYVGFVSDVNRFDSLLRQAIDFQNAAGDATTEAAAAVASARLTQDELSATRAVEDAERLVARAQAAGVSQADTAPLLASFRQSRLTIYLVAPRLLRQLAEQVIQTSGTADFHAALGRFIAAARVDIEADEDRLMHRGLRAYFDRHPGGHTGD